MSDRLEIRWPDGWRRLIDKARKKKTVAEYVRGLVEADIGADKLPSALKRGRPKKKVV